MTDSDAAMLSKARALIEKTRQRVAQIDGNAFPTKMTATARYVVLRSLSELDNDMNVAAMSAPVLYKTLIQFQEIVADIEASSNDHISWPMVRYWEDVWNEFCRPQDGVLFYTTSRHPQYGVYNFTTRLQGLLRPVLTEAAIARVVGQERLYCLQLPTVEDDNLPLYANVAHEFGHPLYTLQAEQLTPLALKAFDAVRERIRQDLAQHVAPSAGAVREALSRRILLSFQRELFADLTAALLSGPAFLLSLYEVAWDHEAEWNVWTIRPMPSGSAPQAHPGFAFRLALLKNWTQASQFETRLRGLRERLELAELEAVVGEMLSFETDHASDQVAAFPTQDPDYAAVVTALNNHLPEIKAASVDFLKLSKGHLEQQHAHLFGRAKPDDVFELILRFRHNLLPNIVPNATLRGQPAEFQAILNAAAIYRLYLLRAASLPDGALPSRELNKIARLTSKALEVSYVQAQFNGWRDSDRHLE